MPTYDNRDNGALLSVNVMGNQLGKEQLAKLQAIMKAHSTLQSLCGIAADATEANLSGLGMDAADAAVIADDIQDKGALASLTFNGGIQGRGSWEEGAAVTINTTMKEADFSNKKLGAAGALILAAFIGRKFFQDNGALACVNLAKNKLRAEGAKYLAKVLPAW